MAIRSQTTGSAVRTIAPLVPLGIALLHGGLAPSSRPSFTPFEAVHTDRAHDDAAHAKSVTTHHCEDIAAAQQCHKTYPEGCTDATKANTYDPYLNYLKNLIPPPEASQSELAGTLTSLDDFQQLDQRTIAMDLGKQKQAPFAYDLADAGEGNIYQAVGYIYYAKPGGVETCNCKLKKQQDKDFHIGLGFDPKVAGSIEQGDIQESGDNADPVVQQTSVIVEMTPSYRAAFHPGWTLPKVRKLVGQQVKVIGQLLVDNEHNTADQNCAFSDHDDDCWRGSAWELHPVMALYVCSAAASCSADSVQGWVPWDPPSD
jgi:hypothetical protein